LAGPEITPGAKSRGDTVAAAAVVELCCGGADAFDCPRANGAQTKSNRIHQIFSLTSAPIRGTKTSSDIRM
jgi:hypothetical protein